MSALDKEYTFTSMQFVPLLEPDLSIRAAKKQLIWTTNTMKDYNMGYWSWKHEYRKKYTEKFLLRYGLNPESTGTILNFDENEVLSYIKSINPIALSASDPSVQLADPEISMRYYLQVNNDWSNNTNILTIDLVNYLLTDVSFKENDDPYIEDDLTTIIGTFINQSTQEEYIIEINNEYLNMKVFSVFYFDVLNTDENSEWYVYIEDYSTIPETLYAEGDMILTPIIALKENNVILTDSLETNKMMNKLGVDGSNFTEMLENEDIDNAYLLQGVPLKNPYEVRVGAYTSLEAEQLSTLLIQKLIKAGETNVEVETPYSTITAAYNVTQEIADEWYNDHLREQAYLARAIFKSFAYYSGALSSNCDMPKMSYIGECIDDIECTDSGLFSQTGDDGLLSIVSSLSENVLSGCKTISFIDNALNMSYGYDISIKTYEGTVRGSEVTDRRSQGDFHFSGKVISIMDSEGDRTTSYTDDYEGFDKLVVRVQKNETEYQEMIITNYSNKFTISGRSFDNTLGSPTAEHRLLLPYIVVNDIRFTEYVTIHEHSFAVLAYAIETITVKWYKRFAGVIIAFALAIFSGGALLAAAIKLVIAMAVQIVIEHVMEMIDSEVLQFLVQVGFMLLNAGMNGFDFSMMTAENYLKLANQVSSLGINAYTTFVAKQQEAEKRAQEMQDQAQENIEDKIDNVYSALTVYPKANMSAHYSSMEINSPEALYADLLGNNLFNFDQFFDVDIQIETRKQVVSG